MKRLNFTGWRPLLALIGAAVLAGCDNGGAVEPVVPPLTDSTYSADIVWTQYGIPHVTAGDWGSLAYGAGYAAAKANYCVMMRVIVDSNGESARYFGDKGNLNLDLVLKMFNDDATVQRIYDSLPEYAQKGFAGYAAGMNRYLADTGVGNLAEGDEGCRNAPWVREVTANDMVRRIHRAMLRASSDPLAKYTVAASPAKSVALAQPAGVDAGTKLVAALDPAAVRSALAMPTGAEIGSNAYAVGADASQTNSGILFGNPHFPWQGAERFFMSHLTLPGEYDVMGSGLIGVPIPLIGFNQNLAWSHTVSTGKRFTLYELELNPQNNLQYVYDGQLRDITSRTVSAQQLQADGTVATVEHTFYFSHFGPIMDLGAALSALGGWPNAAGTVFTYRDANLENLRAYDQWVRMGKAQNLAEFKQALRAVGIPWVNTIAADRFGDALYSDISVVPNVSISQYNSCIRGPLQNLITTAAGLVAMDGSDSACEWGNDADTAPGIFGYDNLPKLETRNYGANANDSHWLANPDQLLEGFSPLIGKERVTQSIRTRHTFDQAEARIAGTDGLGAPGFNVDNIRQLLVGAKNHAASLVLDDVIDICQTEEIDPLAGITQTLTACDILAGWDRAHTPSSVGGHIFFELWNELKSTNNLWSVPFDAADPVHTPRDLNVDDPAVVASVTRALADAVDTLAAAGIPLDRPWGQVQFVEKNGERIPIHGGSGAMMFSVITSNLVDGKGYANITHGNSYIQAVTWDESDCPDAYAILTYSQSTDPASPHYADATRLYSGGGWIDMPYCEGDRDSQEIDRESIEE